MSTDIVTLLGVKGGPAIAPGAFMPTSTLVQVGGQTILVDAALGAAQAIVRAGVALTDLDAILITHMHSDHYLELGPLLHTAWTSGLKRPLPVYGPSGLADYWQAFMASMRYDIDTRIADEGRPDFAPLFPLHVIDPAQGLTLGDVRVTAMLNVHPPVIESYAFRLETPDRRVVLSGDTAPMDAMIAFASDADLLVHEVILTPHIQALVDKMGYSGPKLFAHIMRSHAPAEDVARIAQAAQVRALALNHLIPNTAPAAEWRAAITPHYSGPLHVGTDGMTITL